MTNQKNKKKKLQNTASARSFLGDSFENIIHMCSLEPGDSWKDWHDPYGNKLKIFKNTCRITDKNELSKIIDIYSKSSFDIISRNSYWSCFILSDNKSFFWFIGSDGILRHLIKEKNTWKTIPSILSGYIILKNISSWYLIDEPEVISIEGLGEKYLNIETVYITPWPPEKEILELLEERKIV